MHEELNLSMFRAYDIRTPSEQLTPELARRLTAAEAVYFRDILGAPAVLVAHDARQTGPQYLAIGTEAFLNAGLDVVYLPGVCSTSHFYYAAMRHAPAAAVMFGASHNPCGDTGQKILAPHVVPVAEQIGPEGGLDKIKELYVSGASASARQRGRVRSSELMEDYVQYSMRLAGVPDGGLSETRLCMDFLCGAAGREMLLAFGRAEADLVPLHFVPDGRFPLGDPNPVKENVIQEGLQTLANSGVRWGVFFDGDGDRIDFYRGDGMYLSSSFVYAAVLPEIRKQFTGSHLRVFADLKSNPLAIIEMAKAGVTVDVIRNGHSQIKKSLIDDPTSIGAVEESAHFYQSFSLGDTGPFCTENTLYIALLVARVWQQRPDRFERLFELQQRTQRAREWGYKFDTDQRRSDALRAVRQHFESGGMRAIDRMRNGVPLEATLMRRGIPFDVDQTTVLDDDWLQVCQRTSQSENGLARWEVVGADASSVQQAKQEIAACVAPFGAGTEYQG